MRHVTAIDLDAPCPEGRWLAGGPAPLDDGCAIRYSSTSEGAADAALQSCRVDRLVFVLAGRGTVRIGEASVPISRHVLTVLPAGTPHRLLADRGDRLATLEIFAPPPPEPPFAEATPTRVPDAHGLVRTGSSDAGGDWFREGGFAQRNLAGRGNGSDNARFNLVTLAPGAGSPDFHIHAFDQFYFVIDGEMAVDIGRRRYRASANSFVSIPAGVVHRNFNAGPSAETHVSILVPEPRQGEIFDYSVQILEHEAPMLSYVPADARDIRGNDNPAAD